MTETGKRPRSICHRNNWWVIQSRNSYPEVASKFKHALQEAIKTDRVVSIEYRQSNPDKEQWFEARLVPLKMKGRVIAIVRDVSERVRNAEQMQLAS